MTIPKKRRGFRKIVVDLISYDWRFETFSDEPIYIDIRLTSKPRSKLLIDIDCKDPWLQNIENIRYHHLHPCSSPITPKFVANAIKASLKIGWQPKENHGEFYVKYQGGQFSEGKVIRSHLF